MAELNIDFGNNPTPQVTNNGGNGDQGDPNNGNKPDINGGNPDPNGKTDLNDPNNNKGNGDPNNPDDNGGNNGNNGGEGNQGNDPNNSSTGGLEPGTNIEFDGANYTVDENGNIVDDKGTVFKKADEVEAWLKEMNVDNGQQQGNDDEPLTVAAIQKSIGIEVTDENGKPVEFTNDAEGVNSYIKSVIDLKSNELQEAAINKLYADNPLLKQFQDYVQLTGTPRGFGDIPDRSGIELDKDNENQLVAVIKMAASEFQNKSLNDNYIKYLKDTGSLYDEAKAQLANLQERDKAIRDDITKKAEEQRKAQIQQVEDYWNNIHKTIDSRNLGGYKLPESFVKEVNGKKITCTPNDFFDYLSKLTETDENGNRITKYQKDRNSQSAEDAMATDLLYGWLMYTGGTYKDLVDMAIKDNRVQTLRITSKNNATHRTVKINKPQSKADINSLILS